MGFFSFLKKAANSVGSVGRTINRAVGSVSRAIDSKVGRVVTSVGSKIPVIGTAFSWARDVAPKVAQASDLIEQGYKFGDEVSQAVKDKNLSAVPSLAEKGFGLVNKAQEYKGK